MLVRFNGKEKDYESGFHYYGARYYWSELMTMWISVDPMADKYPSLSHLLTLHTTHISYDSYHMHRMLEQSPFPSRNPSTYPDSRRKRGIIKY